MCSIAFSFGQNAVLYTNVAFDQNIYNYYTSSFFGQGVSFFDFNEDGWDDLTLSNQSDAVYIYKNNEGFFEIWQALQVPNSKAVVWGDLDNDGSNELIVSTLNFGLRLFIADENGYYNQIPNAFNWSEAFPSVSDFWLYGMSLADFNGDHYLDLVVANYNQESQNFLFLNNGQMGFDLFHNNALKYDLKSSFQTAFIDLNKDTKPDLYIANDFEQGNEFYWNQIGINDTMPLLKQSTETGLGIQLNSMCNSWCDFDNDGDLDVYVSNLEPGNQLLENNGYNQFQNIAEQLNVAVNRQCWSSLWVDVNNDQWNDLLASSANPDWPITWWPGSLMMGDGNGTFTQPDTTIFTNSAFTACKGDFNQDGLSDIALNASNEDFFQLYQNTTVSNNHFIKFRLNGTISNRNGVGTHYYLYTQNNFQYGYTQSGDNYLGQNSQNLILGLGENEVIDSLLLIWPSGLMDKYYDLSIDHFHNLYEGQSQWSLILNHSMVCSNQDSILAFIQQPFGVLWDNQSNADSAWFFTGNHQALIQFEGVNIDTVTFTIALFDDSGLTTTIVPEHCTGQDGAINILYQNDTLFQVSHLSDGPFIAIYDDNNGCPAVDTLTVPSDDAFEPLVSSIPAPCQIGSTGQIIIPNQPDITYTIAPWVDSNETPPGEYAIHFTNNNGCILDTAIVLDVEQQWEFQIPPTIISCFGEDLQPDDWISSNLEVSSYDQWPTDILIHDTTIVIEMETTQGCVFSDTIFFQLLLPPSYDTLQENTNQGTLVTITTEDNSTVYFDSNSNNQLLCTESQWQNIVLTQNECQWYDSIWIQVNIPQNIDFKSSDSNICIQNGYELFFKTTHKTPEIIQVVNTLGQEIGFRSLGGNQWILSSNVFPVFIQTQQGWIKTHVQNDAY